MDIRRKKAATQRYKDVTSSGSLRVYDASLVPLDLEHLFNSDCMFRYNGLVNRKAVGVTAAPDNKGFVLSTKRVKVRRRGIELNQNDRDLQCQNTSPD